MGDAVSPEDDLPPLTGDGLLKYLTDRRAELKCELCGNTNFLDMTRYTNALPVKFQNDKAGSFQLNGGIEVVCVVCNNCGNTKLLATAIIQTWLKKQGVG